mgnify:CR=1 FL=1|jgi:hypothetical protein
MDRGEVETSSGIGRKTIRLLHKPTENPVKPAIAPWTAFCPSCMQSVEKKMIINMSYNTGFVHTVLHPALGNTYIDYLMHWLGLSEQCKTDQYTLLLLHSRVP